MKAVVKERIRVLMENLNTTPFHTIAALYNIFEHADARRIDRKFEIHNTPILGSWQKMAEIVVNVFGLECLNRRFPDNETPNLEIAA